MKNITLLLLALISITAVSSCKKNNVNGQLKDRREIIALRPWKIAKLEVGGQTTSLKSCELDDVWYFKSSQGRIEENGTQCDDNTASFPAGRMMEDPTEFTWSFTGDLRYLLIRNFGANGEEFNWEVQNMNYDEFTIYYSENKDGSLRTYKVIFVGL